MIVRTQFPRLATTFGVIQCESEIAAEAYVRWQTPILTPHGLRLVTKAQQGDLDSMLAKLLPLTAPVRTRFAFVPLESGWSLFFDNGVQGADAASTMRVLAQQAGVPAARVTCQTDRPGFDNESASEQFGARIVEVFGADGATRRTVFVANDGGKWKFGEVGERLPFERSEDYEAPRLDERFAESALANFLVGLGVADRERGLCMKCGGISTLIEKMGALPASLREYFVDPQAA